MVSELSSGSGQKVCGDAKSEISAFVSVGRGGSVRFAWLCENNGAGGNEVFLVAVREVPGAAGLEGYFELFVEVTGADIRGGWADDDFEVVMLGQALNLNLWW